MDDWSLFAMVFCRCGWSCTVSGDWTVRCGNPACDRYGQAFRLEVDIQPVEPAELGEQRPQVVM